MKTDLILENKITPLDLKQEKNNFLIEVFNRKIKGLLLKWDPPYFKIEKENEVLSGYFFRFNDFVDIHLPEGSFRIQYSSTQKRKTTQAIHPAELTAPMPGKVIKVMVKEGDLVESGNLLMILEAMKMEHKIISSKSGVIQKIFFKENDRVSQGQELLEIK